MRPPQLGEAASAFTGRFVVLRHEMPAHAQRSSHWDLLLEAGPVLAAWELPCPLLASRETSGPITGPARRLPDHRVLYLDYQGPIAGDRGHVTRVAAGVHHTHFEPTNLRCPSDVRWIIELMGCVIDEPPNRQPPSREIQLAGRLTIEPLTSPGDSSHRWNWEPSPSEVHE